MGRSLRQNSAPNTVPRSSSEVNAASPSSHVSNLGFASSSATTPESSADSPAQRKASEPTANGANLEQAGESGNNGDFCKLLPNPPALI